MFQTIWKNKQKHSISTRSSDSEVLQVCIKINLCGHWHQKSTVWSGAANKVRDGAPRVLLSVKHPSLLRHFWIISQGEVHFHRHLSFLVNTEGNHFQVNGPGQAHVNTVNAKLTVFEQSLNL